MNQFTIPLRFIVAISISSLFNCASSRTVVTTPQSAEIQTNCNPSVITPKIPDLIIEFVGCATVNTSLTIAQAVEAGQWDNRRVWGNIGFDHILSQPPFQEPMRNQADGTKAYYSLRFRSSDDFHYTEDIREIGRDHGLRATTAHETLAFGAEHPDALRKKWTVGLNAQWKCMDNGDTCCLRIDSVRLNLLRFMRCRSFMPGGYISYLFVDE